MRPSEFRQTRRFLHLTQAELADKLQTTRRSIIRYEDGSRRIPGMAEVVLQSLATAHVELSGVVAAGEPIEPIPPDRTRRSAEEHDRTRRDVRSPREGDVDEG